MAPKNIVIVGGGGGARLARALAPGLDASKFTLTLINDRPFAIHYPAMLRNAVTSEGNIDERAWIPFDHVFPPGSVGTFKQGKAVSVDDTAVVLESGETVPYDYLVLATGSKWENMLDFPQEKPEATKFVEAWRERVANASEVVIVGGGAVGIELAGEISDFYPSTTVHLVHAQPLLLNDVYPNKIRKQLASQLEAKGVKLHLGDRAEIPSTPGGTITTQNGVQLKADLFIPTRGPKPNTEFLRSFGVLNSQGYVKVLPTLQVEGKPKIFALGDIIEWDEQKMLYKAGLHAPVVAANLQSIINGGSATKEYKTDGELLMVTVGRYGGYGFMPKLWGINLGPWLTSNLKSKTLFVDKARGDYGY